MTNLKRYDVEHGGDVGEYPNGEFVRYEDIEHLLQAEPPADLGGCSIVCSACGKETVLRYTDQSKTHVEITSVTGWTFDPSTGVRCPSCLALNRGAEHG